MKAKLITYWIATALISLMMGFSAYAALSHSPQMVEGMTHLGYPVYFAYIAGTANLLGVCALLAPGLPLLKEWAYAGFTFTFIGAVVSHLESGDGPKALLPVVALVVLALSYFLRPAGRRLAAR